MASGDVSGELLFGLLALQTGLVDQGTLFTAFNTWSRDKARPMAEVLVGLGALDEAQRDLVAALVAQHLRRHGGDTEKSLAAIGAGASTQESLASLGDPDLARCLGIAAETAISMAGDADRTTTLGVGAATSEGQRFRVLRPHARGGLGAVFVALDGELNREVALKQIQDRHADDPVSRGRFVLEAEITGGLEHPGIIPVYGLGKDQAGRPYYAMRFVRGDSLKEAIAAFHSDEALKSHHGRRSLALRQLLRRFVDVCNAIEYAHRRGVLHRDLKPSNIMVGKHGETLVIDWGLAKAVGKHDAPSIPGEATLRPGSGSGSSDTVAGSALGTPGYMSPEQAIGDLDHLGGASDVYSLGATLYCLLTGKPAFEGDDIGRVLAAVGKGTFPRPRAVEPSTHPALEAICLKAMALSPSDRYPSPRSLADDVERWLADEPVSAWRETRAIRARRWAGRRSTLVTVAAATVLAATLALAGATYYATRAYLREGRALDRMTQARDAEARAKSDASLRAEEANSVVIFFLATVGSELEGYPGTQDVRKRLLERAATYHQQYRQPSNFYAAMEQANSLYRLGRIRRSLGEDAAALEALAKARELYRHIDPQGREDRIEWGMIGNTYLESGLLLWDRARLREAGKEFELAVDALQRRRKLITNYPPLDNDLASAHNNLALVLKDQARLDEAGGHFRDALRIRRAALLKAPENSGLLTNMGTLHENLAMLEDILGRPDEGRKLIEQGLPYRERAIATTPGNPEYLAGRALDHANLARYLGRLGRDAEADGAFVAAIAEYRDLVARNPGLVRIRENMARATTAHASLLARIGRHESSATLASETLAALAELRKIRPGIPGHLAIRVRASINLSRSLLSLGRKDEAMAAARLAESEARSLVKDAPEVPGYADDLAQALRVLGETRAATGDPSGAEAALRDSIATAEALAQLVPAIPLYREGLARSHASLGDVLRSRGKSAEAVAAFDEAVASMKRVVAIMPGINYLDGDLAAFVRARDEARKPL